MEIKIEITFTPAATDGAAPAPAKLRVRMTEPGRSELELKDYCGDAAECVFAGLYTKIQEARLTGHLQCEADARVNGYDRSEG